MIPLPLQLDDKTNPMDLAKALTRFPDEFVAEVLYSYTLCTFIHQSVIDLNKIEALFSNKVNASTTRPYLEYMRDIYRKSADGE